MAPVVESQPGQDAKEDLVEKPHKGGIKTEDSYVEGESEAAEMDIFEPLPDGHYDRPENERVLTIRAVLVGSILGSLVNASNLYLGLRTGWSMAAVMFGTIMGFAILKPLSLSLPESFPIFGGYFGPKENSIVLTAAVTSGGLSFIFISGVPSLYQLGLLSDDPLSDYWRLVTFTFICAYYGMMFAVPMRRFFLRTVARDLKLIFPGFTVAAITIRSFHQSGQRERKETRATNKVLGYSFLGAFLLRVLSQYAPGILWDWHFFTWFYIWGNHSNAALAGESWQWFFELTPAFFSTGMLVGPNPAFSFLGGAVLAWGIIGPISVAVGATAGIQPFVGTKWAPYTIYTTMESGSTPGMLPSPRYWLLWPGIMIMLCASFMEMMVHYKVFYRTGKSLVVIARQSWADRSQGSWKRSVARLFQDAPEDADQDDQIRWYMWLPGTLLLVVISCVVLYFQYSMAIGPTLVALVFGFVFAFMTIQCFAVTEVSPVGAIAKLAQLVLGGMVNQSTVAPAAAYTTNIAGAQIAGGAAYAAAELMADLRVGYLLKTPLRQQLLAQTLGNVVAIFLSPLIFLLFVQAYPCIMTFGDPTCAFPAPAATAWSGIAQVVTATNFPIPSSSAFTALALGIFSALLVVFRHACLTGTREKYKVYVPNMSILGLSFVLPSTCFAIAMAAGALAAIVWAKKWPASHKAYLYFFCAGATAGEGIGGVVNAILQIAKVSGAQYGSFVGCPLDRC